MGSIPGWSRRAGEGEKEQEPKEDEEMELAMCLLSIVSFIG